MRRHIKLIGYQNCRAIKGDMIKAATESVGDVDISALIGSDSKRVGESFLYSNACACSGECDDFAEGFWRQESFEIALSENPEGGECDDDSE